MIHTRLSVAALMNSVHHLTEAIHGSTEHEHRQAPIGRHIRKRNLVKERGEHLDSKAMRKLKFKGKKMRR